MPHPITSLLTKTEAGALEARMRRMLNCMGCTLRKSPTPESSDPCDAMFMVFLADGSPVVVRGEDNYCMDLADVAEYTAG